MRTVVKSLAVLAGLGAVALPALGLVGLAQLRLLVRPPKRRRSSGRTVLLTGGKMTKCLQLARMFHAMGDRVIVAETSLYRWCGTRFSNAVDHFELIPDIEGDGGAYCRALAAIAERENVDLFVPVASPKAALYDALAKSLFPPQTEVFHFDAPVVEQLDDKHAFSQLCRSFELSAPESYWIESKEALLSMAFQPDKQYILKKIDYDPVYRLDLRPLPHEGWEERVAALPIGKQDPWVLQEFVQGREVCTHTTARDGAVKLYICSDSSPFQVNYAMLDLPSVRAWVDAFVKQLGATGQISFDFIIRDNGEVVPIECNPRTHSAITLFHNQLSAAAAYYPSESSDALYLPDEDSGHTYWWYHELYRMMRADSVEELRALAERAWTGQEAVFSWDDPWPFWFNNHVSIPYQLWRTLRRGASWTHIDFNIGKIAVKGGD